MFVLCCLLDLDLALPCLASTFVQFPNTGYGGIEISVERLAWALHSLHVPFVVIVPVPTAPTAQTKETARSRDDFPFEILEVEAASESDAAGFGFGFGVGSSLPHTPAQRFVKAAAEAIATRRRRGGGRGGGGRGCGGRGVEKDRGVIVWSQSHWSMSLQDYLSSSSSSSSSNSSNSDSVAQLVTFHDSTGSSQE